MHKKTKKTTTYVKLQDAFVSELNTSLGQFAVIGYKMPNGNVFEYTDNVANTADGTSAISAHGTATKSWTAKAIVALNDCAVNSEWGLFTQKATDGNGLEWSTGIKEGAAVTNNAADQDCVVLTPSFKTLAK
ncbi:hypothetical protein [Fibrobacter sp. UWR2]|uniref:hypothetical protein n=1 Tax=Fibrobacter sp. UWR2 TaxID=1964352 RepID=UPI000B51E832|nr:hypothetical protein [Fibrobacter sp. UWR2]OWV00764.1 hypothetical protein B7994_06895 [Fibrobacter sp. UWR2]